VGLSSSSGQSLFFWVYYWHGGIVCIGGQHGGPTVLFVLLLGMNLSFISVDSRLSLTVALASQSVLRLGVAALDSLIAVEQIYPGIGFASTRWTQSCGCSNNHLRALLPRVRWV
jgi:uncharacterized membrane protein YadS